MARNGSTSHARKDGTVIRKNVIVFHLHGVPKKDFKVSGGHRRRIVGLGVGVFGVFRCFFRVSVCWRRQLLCLDHISCVACRRGRVIGRGVVAREHADVNGVCFTWLSHQVPILLEEEDVEDSLLEDIVQLFKELIRVADSEPTPDAVVEQVLSPRE